MRWRPTLALLSTLLLAACARDEDPLAGSAEWASLGKLCWWSSPAYSLPAARRDSLATHNPLPENARLAEITREIGGGWGGAILTGPERVVLLQDPSQLERIHPLLAARNLLGGVPLEEFTARKVRWDYAQLYDWYRYVVPHTDGVPVFGYGISEWNNRIELTVVGESSRRALEARLRPLDLPCYLVAIEVAEMPPSLGTGSPLPR